ncbi:MAG: hypothetical protein KIT09_00930 [Bryobacteraceae bacterium]|nr:hypothetical protein [Bryobacteraceae bacterium]
MQRVGDLKIDQDLQFEGAELRIERLAWCLMLLIVVAAMLGLFGTGLLNRSSAYATGIELRYSRFGRMNSATALEITASPEMAQDGLVKVWLAREYAASIAKRLSWKQVALHLLGIDSSFRRQARVRHVDEQYWRSLRTWPRRNHRPQFGSGRFAHWMMPATSRANSYQMTVSSLTDSPEPAQDLFVRNALAASQRRAGAIERRRGLGRDLFLFHRSQGQ